MGKKQQKTGEPTVAPAEPFDALVHNAIDFVEMSIRDLTARPKYSVIHFASAVELFFKARLFREHWSLKVLRPETAVWTQMQSGNFRSVSLPGPMSKWGP